MKPLLRTWLGWFAFFFATTFFLHLKDYLVALEGEIHEIHTVNRLIALLASLAFFLISLVGSGVRRVDLKILLGFFLVLSSAMALPAHWLGLIYLVPLLIVFGLDIQDRLPKQSGLEK